MTDMPPPSPPASETPHSFKDKLVHWSQTQRQMHIPPIVKSLRELGVDVDGAAFMRFRRDGQRLICWLQSGDGQLFGWTVLSCFLCVLFLDRPLAYWCHDLPPPIRDFFGDITHLGKSEPYLFGGFALFAYFRYIYRNKHLAARAGFVFLSVAASGIAVNIVKMIFGRARPNMLFADPPFYGFDPLGLTSRYQSFPSGHTSTVVALALCGFTFLPRLWPLWGSFALAVAMSRVAIGSHYPADLISSAFITYLVTDAIRKRLEGNGYRLRIAPAP